MTHGHFGDLGFIAADRHPIDESAHLPRYRVKFDRNQVDPRLSGFDEEAFAREFTRRGGIWLSDLGSDYQTYDGEHLQLASALRFSDALSASLGERLSDDR